MPMLPKRPCPVAGCPVLGPCAVHRRPALLPTEKPRLYDDRRGSSAQRGYGYAWRQRRKEYIKLHPFCVRCGKPTTERRSQDTEARRWKRRRQQSTVAVQWVSQGEDGERKTTRMRTLRK